MMKWFLIYAIVCVIAAAVIALAVLAALTWVMVTLVNRSKSVARVAP
jgi:hypothetical protein